MEIRFKKCGISNQPNVCIFDDPCFSKFGALRGSCPHPGRQFVGHAPVGLSKRGRDTESDANIQPEEMHAFFSTNVPSTLPAKSKNVIFYPSTSLSTPAVRLKRQPPVYFSS